MRKFLGLAAACVLGVALNAGTASACSADFVAGNAGGTWQVNNAGGEGFGGWFVTADGDVVEEDKPQVSVAVGEEGLSIGGSGELSVTDFHDEENPNGGTWCGFTLNGQWAARLGHADNGWWILEVGNYDDRNKVELIRR